ncbi:MAG TPA: hypothetical protein DEF05_01435 [Erwinia sp.]|uniref:hypothetical protein n=1 Tax=Erwinia citreus TaxID=558 RepID=UPI000E8DDB26|nr:hypothetical protein [Erwinia sp.]HBV38372.1 hypothetical protein [Erwinia sp.]
MSKYFLACFFALFACSASAGHGDPKGKEGHGGYMGSSGADGGNGSDGGSTDNTPGRPGCPGGTDPDLSGKFYLPGTTQECNPGKQDSMKKHPPTVTGA